MTIPILMDGTEGERIGIFISGGVDSTLMLYLLLKENLIKKKKIYCFCIPCLPQTTGVEEYTIKCLEEVQKILNYDLDPPKLIMTGDPYLEHWLIVYEAWRAIYHKKIVDSIFIGDNANPPLDQEIVGLRPDRNKSSVSELKQPLLYHDKSDVVKIFFDLGIESLLSYCHSCSFSMGECHNCWQCCERDWAFEKIGKDDPRERFQFIPE